MRKLIAFAAVVTVAIGMGGVASAGEVTGKHVRNAAPAHSNSICSYSGLEDGSTLIGFDADGNPIFVDTTPWGPGIVQTPHQDGGMIHDPGIPGTMCHGGSNPENPR